MTGASPNRPSVRVRCAICGKDMGVWRNASRWIRFRLWLNGGSYCSDDCWAWGVH